MLIVLLPHGELTVIEPEIMLPFGYVIVYGTVPFPETIVEAGDTVVTSPALVAVKVALAALVTDTEIVRGLPFFGSVTESEAEIEQLTGDGDGDGDALGDGDGDGLGEAVADGDGEGVGDADGSGDGEGVGDADGSGDGEGVGDELGLAPGDGKGVGVGTATTSLGFEFRVTPPIVLSRKISSPRVTSPDPDMLIELLPP
jgi:hypothetical protein